VPAEQPSLDELAAAGLFDPEAPGAAERRELLEWFVRHGFSLDDIVAAHRSGNLVGLAGDSLQRAGVHLSLRQMAERSGVPLEHVVEVRRATGLAPTDPDVPVFTDDDVEAYAMLVAAAELFSWPALLQFLRVVGSSVARIADAANALFLHDVEHPLKTAGATELDLARRGVQAMELASGVGSVLRMLLRLHLIQAVERTRSAVATSGAPTLDMAVGFVDLVGFTPRAADMDPDALAELVTRFEATAHDLITDLGGRLVKVIGDEVMFVAVEAATACDIALALLRTFGADPALTPRGGLAYGEVLARSGDYFGPTVNLASRLAEQAVPGEVLATPEVAAAAPRQHVEPAGRRQLKGFTEPVAVVSLTAPPGAH
jgi:class 3 adenylate cyclase